MSRKGAASDSALIAARLEAAGLGLGEAEEAALARFLELLLQWNRVHNLTGITNVDELVERHIVESLALRGHLHGARIADIGSGAGLPGLPLAIAEPGRAFTLIESRVKRVSFLRHVQGSLALANVTVEHGRAEDLPSGAAFDTLLARAVGPPGAVIEIARGCLAAGGRLLVLTSAARTGEYLSLADDFDAHVARRDPGLASSIVVLERN